MSRLLTLLAIRFKSRRQPRLCFSLVQRFIDPIRHKRAILSKQYHENCGNSGVRPLRYNGGFMARIIGGIGSSHSPTIGFAFDRQKQNDPVWAPIFQGYEPIRQWLAE